MYVGALMWVLLLFLSSGCAIGQRPLVHPEAVERRCGPVSPVQRMTDQHLLRLSADTAIQPGNPDVLAGRFSPQSQSIAERIGVKHLLVRAAMLEGKADRDLATAVERLHVQQQISDRIALALLDVARTAAEADCEEKRADQLAEVLGEERDKHIRRLLLISIVGDAMIGIVAGGLNLAVMETAAAAAEIFGGAVATWFGVASLSLSDEARHEFRHQRNLLQEVWIGPKESSLIPPSVWRHMTRPLPEDPENYSLRESLIRRWRQDGRLGEAGSEPEQRRIDLYFGEGGSYSIGDLRDRAAMLELLKADVNLMSQDLERLMEEILSQGSA
ncbi:MAG: hypothetical protein CV088_01450 [Nitrospira sp. LK70]|nr:hypothetical protein [Nitrospira sp. LK70]